MKTNAKPTTITTKLEPAIAQRLAAQLKRATGETLAALLPQVAAWKESADRKHEDLIRRASAEPRLRNAVKGWDKALPILHHAIARAQRRLQPVTPAADQEQDGHQGGERGQDGSPAPDTAGNPGGTPAPAAATGQRLSGLDAAARILGEAGAPLGCTEMVRRMLEQGLWSTAGKTPAATINAAIIREIRHRGEGSRFRKAGRGLFARA